MSAGRATLWIPALSAMLSVLLCLCSCRDDDCPTCPVDEPVLPTLENIWPNADSTFWVYSVEERMWPDSSAPVLYQSEAEVEPAPGMDEIAAMLDSAQTGDSPDVLTGIYHLIFDGDITTGSGVTAQFLRSTIYCESSTLPKPLEPRLTSRYPTSGSLLCGCPPNGWAPSGFLQKLLTLRPELRDRAMALGLLDPIGDDPSSSMAPDWGRNGPDPQIGRRNDCGFFFSILYLHGYAWTKTQEYIGGYGDVDQLLAWKYLEADLSPGHEFTQQLVPGLVDDVFLHARILRHGPVSTEAGDFDECVTCLYSIDYGVMRATDESGGELGYFRSFDYGTIAFAPGIGPVYSYERHPPLVPIEAASDPYLMLVTLEKEIGLMGTNASWP